MVTAKHLMKLSPSAESAVSPTLKNNQQESLNIKKKIKLAQNGCFVYRRKCGIMHVKNVAKYLATAPLTIELQV